MPDRIDFLVFVCFLLHIKRYALMVYTFLPTCNQTTMIFARLFAVLFMSTLRTEVAAKDACSLPSNGTDSCSPAFNTGTYNLSSNHTQHIKDGSCDFGQGPCGYIQGCQQERAPEWRHSARGYFEMRATLDGGYGNTSVLESPVLDISRPSCLSFTGSLWIPVLLAVVLSTAHTNCTLLTRQTHFDGGNRSFAVDLPLGVAKIMFQGFHGGDNVHYVRIYNVSVDLGCCQDAAWTNVMNHTGSNPDHPHCSWRLTDWIPIPSLGAAVTTIGTAEMLTTPLIRATSPGTTDCLVFEYVISNHDGNSLTVCIVGMQNVCPPLWVVLNKNNTGTGAEEYLKGQIPVSSSAAFKIRFTGRRDSQNAVIAIRNFLYQRGHDSTDQCTFEPPEALPHDTPTTNDSYVIAGGVTTAVVIVAAMVIIGGIILWRKRRRQRNLQQIDSHNSPNTETPPPRADSPIVSPENYERLNAVSEQREYAVLPAVARQPTDSTYYELPSGERPAVAGTAGRNPNHQNLPVPENGLSDTANAGSAEGGD